MKPRTPGHWLIAAIIGLFALSSAHAGMTPAEVKAFMDEMKKAEKGDRVAQYTLGNCYYNGAGVANDEAQAVSWYRKAAEQGLAQAQYNLGVCHEYGTGVPKDFVQGVSWYRKAAEQGHAKAQFYLGFCYSMGEGVARDQIEAYAFYSLAAITDEGARHVLDILEEKMSAGQIAAGQKRSKELQKEIDAKSAAKKAGK